MKIALINIPIETSVVHDEANILNQGLHPHFPLGLMSLVGVLLSRKIVAPKDILLLDTALFDVVETVKKFKPDIVGLSSFTLSYFDTVTLAKKIKRETRAALVVGGVHVTVAPKSIDKIFDYGFVGESEESFSELITLLKKTKLKPTLRQLRSIGGMIFRHNGKLLMSAPRPLVKNLDSFPPNNYSLISPAYFKYEAVKIENRWHCLKVAALFTSRGCPYNCIFCARKSIWPGIRFYGVPRVADEIEELYKNYGVQGIHIYDDTFPVSKLRIKQLVEELKRRKLLGKIVFYDVFARTDQIEDETLKLLKVLGVSDLTFGFESGNDRVLALLKNNTTTVTTNRRAVKLLAKYKINATGSFMVGNPTEKIEEMQDTINFIKWFARQKPAINICFSSLIPFPGTKIWGELLRQKIVSDNMDWRWLGCGINFFSDGNQDKFNKVLIKTEKAMLSFMDSQLRKSNLGEILKERAERNRRLLIRYHQHLSDFVDSQETKTKADLNRLCLRA